jgi:hypothetical protein
MKTRRETLLDQLRAASPSPWRTNKRGNPTRAFGEVTAVVFPEKNRHLGTWNFTYQAAGMDSVFGPGGFTSAEEAKDVAEVLVDLPPWLAT